MAATQEKLLQELSDNIEKLREKGISLGLSDLEIDSCMVKVLRRPDDAQRSRGKAKKSRGCVYRVFRMMALSTFTVVAFVCVMALISAVHQPTDRILGQLLEPLSYPFFRALRLASLPIITRYDVTGLYESSCLIPNPLMVDGGLDCDACIEVDEVHPLHNVTPVMFKKSFMEHWQYTPVVVMDEDTYIKVTFNQLKDLFIKNDHVFTSGKEKFYSTDPRVTSSRDLFLHTRERDVMENHQFHAEWYTKQMITAQVIRQLFPRQRYFPRKVEISPDKKIIVQNSRVEKHAKISSESFGGLYQFTWYVQAAGIRHVTLTPDGQCSDTCKMVEITLDPGQSLFYFTPYWTLETHPAEAGDDVSVAFIGHFT